MHELLFAIRTLLGIERRNREKEHDKIMKAIENLTAAITTLTTAVDAVLAKPSPEPGVPEADVQAAADAVNAQAARLTA